MIEDPSHEEVDKGTDLNVEPNPLELLPKISFHAMTGTNHPHTTGCG